MLYLLFYCHEIPFYLNVILQYVHLICRVFMNDFCFVPFAAKLMHFC